MKKTLLLTLSAPFFIFGLTKCADSHQITLDDTDTNTFCTALMDKIACPDGTMLELPEIEPIKGATIVSFIYPCSDTSNNQEILIRLSNGSILGVFDGDTSQNPGQTRLVELAPGNYVTTDQNNYNNRCRFTITNNGLVNPSLEVEVQND